MTNVVIISFSISLVYAFSSSWNISATKIPLLWWHF